MNWGYRIDGRALKDLKKLGKPKSEQVIRYLDKNVISEKDPRRFGKALKHNLSGLWCCRIGDVRVVCEIRENDLVIRVGFRRDVYE